MTFQAEAVCSVGNFVRSPQYLTGGTLMIHFMYMPTTKRRLNITLSPAVEKFITEIAKRDQVPAATKISELLNVSLLIEEDRALSMLADVRFTEKGKKLTSTQVWGK